MTNAYLARFALAADRVFKKAGMADDATYKATSNASPIPCTIYVTRDVQQVGVDMETADTVTTLQVSSAVVDRPPVGATFNSGGETFTVARLESSDEAYHLCVVEVSP